MFKFVKKCIPNCIKRELKKMEYIVLHPFLMHKNSSKKLNIGAGKERVLGFINVDIDSTTKPDILCNIEHGLPFDDNTIDEIKCSHTLEHINDILFVLREFYRISKKGTKITIIVPLMDASDMTHVRFFNEYTFRTLTDSQYWDKPYYFVGKYKELSRSFKELDTCREMTLILEVIK